MQLLADDYGYPRGWYRSHGSFCLGQLERRSNHTRRGEYAWADQHPLLDHVFYYRVGRRPAAIVSHPYHVDERAVAELRQRYLLNVVVDDYPSWRNPGWTRTLVITPDEERIAELGAEAERLRALHGKGSIQKWRDHLQGRKPLYLRGRAGWPFPAPGFGSKGVPDPAYGQLRGVS